MGGVYCTASSFPMIQQACPPSATGETIGSGLSGPNLVDWAVSMVTPASSFRVRVGWVRSGESTVVCRPRKIKRSISACRHQLSSAFVAPPLQGGPVLVGLVVLVPRWDGSGDCSGGVWTGLNSYFSDVSCHAFHESKFTSCLAVSNSAVIGCWGKTNSKLDSVLLLPSNG